MPLWEESIPLMREGYHKKIRDLAYGPAAKGQKVYPPPELVFNAMRQTPFTEVRVVILGQDPYINEFNNIPEAHGLCFSVRQGLPVPPSLKNIFKEIQNSIYPGTPHNFSTDLTRWAKQGVLLLNASLSVLAGKSNSHADLGWHQLTDNIIETVSAQKEHVVFMLWGAFAQKKETLIDKRKHLVLKTSHPSPLSAHRGFLGSGVFVKCNAYLQEHGLKEVMW
ncbi:MAG: uracil-DNA glycosylase [Proteobacteria bacterium]|nr:uracil-DNA glycosylase [Pseudomonadota bacterium]MBU1738137.1 uracil-DNA glycosylase [Pseudomonadota bacterium]